MAGFKFENSGDDITALYFVDENGQKTTDIAADTQLILVTNDFLIGGGDGYEMFADKPIHDLGSLAQLLINHFNSGN